MAQQTGLADQENAAAAFARIVGPEHVITDEAERRYYSTDIFYWDETGVAACVAQPATAGEVAALIKAAAALGFSVSIRGGGMSYTNGYGPAVHPSVLMDLRRMNAVREINLTDRYVVVEAGCTWAALSQALKATGARLAFNAPFSGIYSTVGGALSQGVPGTMGGILGLEVVRGDGAVVHTGAWSRKGQTPFTRQFGPDLTGLFLGDSGAYGLKTAASLTIDTAPESLAHGSFAFESYEDMAEALVGLGPYDFLPRRVGLDPFKSQNAAKVGFKEAVRTLSDVTASGASLVSGLKDSVKMASAGANFMEGVKWSLHLTASGADDEIAGRHLGLARAICLKRGREIANILPRALDAKGFSVRGFLGKDGQRWVPTHGIFPLSQAVTVTKAVQRFFDDHRADMKALGMWESYMTSAQGGYFMCEPSFYWVDEVSPLHLRHLPSDEARKFKKIKANGATRPYAQRLRAQLRDLFFSLGAVHVQLAKFYRYRDAVEPETWRLVKALKNVTDPDHRLNPGNLGLD